jgi:hypothetical protein
MLTRNYKKFTHFPSGVGSGEILNPSADMGLPRLGKSADIKKRAGSSFFNYKLKKIGKKR